MLFELIYPVFGAQNRCVFLWLLLPGASLLVGMLDQLWQIFRVEGVDHIEKVLGFVSLRALNPFILHVLPYQLVGSHQFANVLGAQFIELRYIYNVNLRSLKQLFVPTEQLFDKELVDIFWRRSVVLEAIIGRG